MTRIRSSIRQIFTSFLLVYLSAVLLATDSCTRLSRGVWPHTQASVAIMDLAQTRLDAPELAQLQGWTVIADREIRAFFRSAVFAGGFLCPK